MPAGPPDDGPADVDLVGPKRALRLQMRAIRAAIAEDPADRAARSARIWARIVSFVPFAEFAQTSRVMLFDGLPTEPETEPWAAWCRDRGVEVLLPAVHGPALRVMPGDVDPGALDLVVVPGLAFTADGRRLGQGGGHYDRFLARLRPDCLTVGACFAEQLVRELPTEPHDQPVDAVATDSSEGLLHGRGAGRPRMLCKPRMR